MYHYVTDRELLSAMKRLYADAVNRLVQKINNDGVMEVKAFLIGSGAKNLITQNGSEPIDLDYNLCICDLYGKHMSEHDIKEYVREVFNEVLREKGLGVCKDSRAVLSTKKKPVMKDNPTKVKMDLAIVRETERGWERLVHHEKTGFVNLDRYCWNLTRDSKYLREKVQRIKERPELWQEVRDRYLHKKNTYLCRNDHDHPSFVVYMETINEVYYAHFGTQSFPVRIMPEVHRTWFAGGPNELLTTGWE